MNKYNIFCRHIYYIIKQFKEIVKTCGKIYREIRKMKRNICGIMIDDLDRRALTAEISQRLREKRRTVIFTPNPIMVQNAKSDRDFFRILGSSDYNIPDGNGIILASRLLKTPIPERICGIELAESMLEFAARQGLGVFLYGGKQGVAELAGKRLTAKYRGLRICGVAHGYHTEEESRNIINRINTSGASLLYVCLGSPKQEKWIDRNASKLPKVLLFMGLGGSLDVWSGNITRAPRIMRDHGAEWAWRMAKSPKKLKDLPKLVSFGASAVAKRLFSVVIMHR